MKRRTFFQSLLGVLCAPFAVASVARADSPDADPTWVTNSAGARMEAYVTVSQLVRDGLSWRLETVEVPVQWRPVRKLK